MTLGPDHVTLHKPVHCLHVTYKTDISHAADKPCGTRETLLGMALQCGGQMLMDAHACSLTNHWSAHD